MQLFEMLTTVDPSYIISLIRKLLPTDASDNYTSHGVDACVDGKVAINDHVEESSASQCGDEILNSSNNSYESMNIVQDYDKHARPEGENEESCHGFNRPSNSVGEEAWEEYGCILWDLAASKTNAELMVLKFHHLLLTNCDVFFFYFLITCHVIITFIHGAKQIKLDLKN